MSTHRRSKQRMAMVSPEPVQRKPFVSPEGTRRSHRVTTASPANSKSLLGEKLHKQITKTQRDLAGRITSVLTEYENAEQLSNLLQGPEDCMAERIVEVLEVLKGRGSTRAKPRTAVN
jgi:NAD dependent epimerase/dehydratase family enzyme